jgi:predicted acetyltransferase
MTASLVPPSPRHAASYIAALREGFRRGIQPITPKERIAQIGAGFERYLAEITDPSGTIRLPSGEVVPKVPFSLLWLVEGDAFIGEISIRHRLNAWLLQEGGHIGYGIRPSLQGRGYGRLILKLGLEVCRDLGIEHALATCKDDNLASARIIEANGGRLENVIDDPAGGGRTRRYWISLGSTALGPRVSRAADPRSMAKRMHMSPLTSSALEVVASGPSRTSASNRMKEELQRWRP